MSTSQQQLKDLYTKQLSMEKDQLQANYAAANADYDAQKKAGQKALDQSLNRTAVEAQQAAINQSELHNAYGLSSGARSQARMALENQKASDMAALRQSQLEQDAQLERQRAAMAQQYQQEIRRAQQENDLSLAQALYEDAQKEQAKLDAKREAETAEADQGAWTLAQLMAEAGDYTPMFNYLRARGVNASYDQLAVLMGEETPGASSLIPLSSTAIREFITNNQQLEQYRNSSRSYYEWAIKNALSKADLTFDEFEALEKYYGI